MARANYVAKARKNIPGSDIKKGESYYWWKFRYGGKRVSRTPPRRSQLTSSDFLSQIYSLEEQIEDLMPDADAYLDDPESLKSDLEDIASEIRLLGEEQADKVGNMPDGLQQGPTGELLQNRADECEAWADELENVQIDVPEREDGEEDEKYRDRVREAVAEAIAEAQGTSYNGE